MRPSEFDNPVFLDHLRNGNSAAYRSLIQRYHRSLTGVAASIIGSHAQAEEVVQDAWLAVFSGIGRFEGRCSLVTWLFTIVLNRARSRASSEYRLVALPAELGGAGLEQRSVAPATSKPDAHRMSEPRLQNDLSPERIVGGRQLWDLTQEIIETLPRGQRAVLLLCDIEGRTAKEACELLNLTTENQRVLLHRARSRLRQAVDAATLAATSAKRARSARRLARGDEPVERLTTTAGRPFTVHRSGDEPATRARRPRQAAHAGA
jgi:RNA polymerase sigma-70 factor, ECF subfamily